MPGRPFEALLGLDGGTLPIVGISLFAGIPLSLTYCNMGQARDIISSSSPKVAPIKDENCGEYSITITNFPTVI